MKIKLIKCAKWMLRLAVFISVLIFILAIWIKNSPPQLSAFYPYIEKELSRFEPEYRFEFKSISLAWPSYHLFPGIQISDVKCYQADHTIIGRCPTILLKVSPLKLLIGRISLSGAALYHPRLTLPHQPEMDASPASSKPHPPPAEEKFLETEQLQPFISALSAQIRSALQNLPDIRKAVLIDAVIERPAAPVKSFHFQRAKLNISSGFFSTQIDLSADCRISRRTSNFDIHLFIPRKQSPSTLTLNIKKCHIASLAAVFPDLAALKGYDIPFSGRIEGKFSADGSLSDFDFSLNSRKGVLHPPGIWEEPLPYNQIKVKGRFDAALSILRLKNLFLDFGGPVFHIDGRIGNLHRPMDDIFMNLRMEKLALTDAARYWPYQLAPHAREWIRDHFYAGRIRQATAQLKLAPGDLEKETLPKEAVTAVVPFENIILNYYQPLPLVGKVSGVGRFSAHDILIEVTGGKVAETIVEKGQVDITGLAGEENTMIDISADVHGPPDDLRNAVDLLVGSKKASVRINKGNADTRLTFRFSLSDFDSTLFEYTARSDIRNLEIPDFHGYRYYQKQLHAELIQNDLTFQGTGGRIVNPMQLDQPIPVKKIGSRMTLLTESKKGGITFSGFKADFGGPVLSGKGSVIKRPGENPAVQLHLQAEKIKTDNLPKYWPKNYAPTTREWIKNHISGGGVHSARIDISLTPQDFSASSLPDDAVKIKAPFDDLSIDYMPPMPKAESVKGVVSISSKGFSAAIESGKCRNTSVASGTVSVADWRPAQPVISISAACQGPPADLISAFEILSPQMHPAMDASVQSGRAATDISIGFPLFKDDPAMTYKVHSNMENLKINDYFGFDLTDGNLQLTVSEKEIKAAGKVTAGSTRLAVNWSDPGQGQERLEVRTSVDAERLKDIRLPDIPYLSGIIDAHAVLRFEPHAVKLDGNFDMQKASISLSPLGWQKPAGETAVLHVRSIFSDAGRIDFPSILMTGNRLQIEGSGGIQLKSDTTAAQYDISFDKMNFGETRFAFNAKYPVNNMHRIDIKGSTLDLSGISFADRLSGSAEKTEKQKKTAAGKGGAFNADIAAHFDRLLLKNNETLTDVRTTASCRKSSLISADLDGLIASDKHLRISVVPSGKSSRLNIQSDDAGRLINSLDISEHFNGGILDLQAELQHPLPADGKAEGSLTIKDYSISQGPVLMNILSLASFVGILEQLKTGSVDFNLLKADLSYDGKTLEVKNGRMEGLSLGMTANGIYDISNDILMIEGIVVPFNMINKLIGIIPVIGKWITGDGIIATKYSASGSAEAPEISIKPLSTLSVGFLKGLFDQLHFHPAAEQSDDSSDKKMPVYRNRYQGVK